jgi:hypothetical protein
MFEFLKTKIFRKIFSFMIGLFIILVLRPICKGEDCLTHVNVTKEVANSTYQIGSKCYTFTPEAYLPK